MESKGQRQQDAAVQVYTQPKPSDKPHLSTTKCCAKCGTIKSFRTGDPTKWQAANAHTQKPLTQDPNIEKFHNLFTFPSLASTCSFPF